MIEQNTNLHRKLIENYRKKNWDYCEQAIEHLKGLWNGEVDSFYNEIEQRVAKYKEQDPGADWDAVIHQYQELKMEMIDRMFADTLWIWTAVAGSIVGAIALAYLKDTRAGIWFYGKVDQCLDFLVARYGWTWLEQPTDAWRKKYPFVTKKIDELEERIRILEGGNSMEGDGVPPVSQYEDRL